MKQILKQIVNKLGIDEAIFYMSLSRIIQALGGVITVLLISRFMSEEEQGYYYTFASVLAIQIFFELGLGAILTQYVAYEMIHLKIENKTNIIGSEKHHSRLASIVLFSTKWYAFFAFALIFTLIFAGGYFFEKNTTNVEVHWRLPWIILSIFTGLNLFISPIIAILQGMHKVREMARFLSIQQFVMMLVSWLSLSLGAKLYFAAINSVVGFVVILTLYLSSSYIKLLYKLLKYKINQSIDYWKEIFPYQSKIALSWISGYFIFQAFNPIVFSFYGAKTAGRVGMSLVIVNAISSLVVSWTSTKIPLWSSLIASKEYDKLDKSVNKTIISSTLVSLLMIFIAIIFILGINYFELGLSKRIISAKLCLFFLMTVPINNIINIWATSLRCNKKEPFLLQAVVVGIFSISEIYITARYFDLDFLIKGYFLLVCLISLPLSYYIFKTKKREYYG